ncbi:hypothetical protein ACIRBX_02605 [Kitasatospora sp. NPDC096147]
MTAGTGSGGAAEGDPLPKMATPAETRPANALATAAPVAHSFACDR